MPAFLLGLLKWAAAGFIARALVGAGITVVTYATVGSYVNSALSQLSTYASGLSGDVLAILSMMGFGDALTIIGGAITARAATMAAGMVAGVKVG